MEEGACWCILFHIFDIQLADQINIDAYECKEDEDYISSSI